MTYTTLKNENVANPFHFLSETKYKITRNRDFHLDLMVMIMVVFTVPIIHKAHAHFTLKQILHAVIVND